MKNLFISYEMSVLAKEKGFDEDCIAYYAYDYLNSKPNRLQLADRPIKPSKFKQKYMAAPVFQQILDWFRVKHNLAILISIPHDVYWRYSIDGINGNGYYTDSSYKEKKDFEDYYEALTTGIQEAFKLI